MKTDFFHEISSDFIRFKLGKKPVTKTRTAKNSFKTVKKNLYQRNLYKQYALRKQTQRKLILFYQTFPQENPTNKSLTKTPYYPPQKKTYKKMQTKYLETILSQKLRTKHIKDFSDNKNLTRTLFPKKNKGNVCKRDLSQTNNYIKEIHTCSFCKNTHPKNIQTTSHRKYLPKKCSPQNLFWAKQQNRKEQKTIDTTKRWS